MFFKNPLWLLLLIVAAACVPAPQPARRPLAQVMAQADPLLAEYRYTEAAAVLENAAGLYPRAPEPLLAQGQIYLAQNRWLLAEDAFNRALARAPANPPALAGLAEALFNQGRLAHAQAAWQNLANTRPDWPGAFTGLGRVYLWQLNFEAARQAFANQQTRRFDPQAAFFLAALTAPVDLPAAQRHLESINTAPDVSPALLAHADYLAAVLAPFSAESPPAEVAAAVGMALAQVEQWPPAVYALTVATEAGASNQAQVLAFLGHALAQLGRPAQDLFEQARRANPQSALPLYFEGLYLRRQGALNAAGEKFGRAVELDPHNAALLVEYGETLAAQGNLAAAEAVYLAAVEAAEPDAPFRLLLAGFYAAHSYRLSEAGLPAAQAVLDVDENNSRAHDLLGWMQHLTGDGAAGEASLRRALVLEPELVSARYHLARLLETHGQAAAAQAEYQRVVDWDTAGAYRQLALKRLAAIPK